MGENILQIRSLEKTFKKNNIKAVQGVSLDVEKGDVFGFLGPNGAGKSTTIRMILGLIKPDKGEIAIDGFNVHLDRFDALERVGALVEGPAFYNYLTAYENLEIFAKYSGETSKDKINEVLKIVGLSRRSTEKVENFSMGMKQRLGIAQSLLNEPRLIILDEPTNGLDPYGVQEIRNLINRLSNEEDITIFISSHILTEIEQICNKVAIINKGKIITTGLVSELLNSNKNIYEIVSSSPDNLIEIIAENNDLSLISTDPIRIRIINDNSEEILIYLVEKGAKISAFFPYKPSLEDFFFEMTRGEEDELCENRAI